MSVMGLKSLDRGWDGWGSVELYPFFLGFVGIFNVCKAPK